MSKKKWVQPSAAETAKALGDLSGLPAALQKALALDADSFPLLPPKPSVNDWLGYRDEPGQPYASFDKLRDRYATPHGLHRTVFVHPVGDFSGPRCPDLRVIKRIAEAFFHGLTFEFLPPIRLDQLPGASVRVNDQTGKSQILTGSLMEYLRHVRTPHATATASKFGRGAQAAEGKGKDEKPWPAPLTRDDVRRELLSLVLTMHDVYPGDEWNFVYGIASAMDGVGVWSFARLDPHFFDDELDPEAAAGPAAAAAAGAAAVSAADAQLILRRCTKILLHETVHLFGIKHCIYRICLINGANHEREMDRQPLYLCPVCLRKFQSACGFDVVTSFRALYAELTAAGLKADAQWYAARLTKMGFALTPTADELTATAAAPGPSAAAGAAVSTDAKAAPPLAASAAAATAVAARPAKAGSKGGRGGGGSAAAGAGAGRGTGAVARGGHKK